MYEHMASAGSLDVVNLPTISADTKMSLHGQLSCIYFIAGSVTGNNSWTGLFSPIKDKIGVSPPTGFLSPSQHLTEELDQIVIICKIIIL